MNNQPRALIVDDEQDIRIILQMTLNRLQIEASTAKDLAGAKAILKKETFDFCFTDMRLPDGDGLSLVDYVQEECPNMPIAVITAYGSMETAIHALKAGAFDFISKPIDLSVLKNLIDNALQLISITPSVLPKSTPHPLHGHSACMQQLRGMIQKISRSQAPVFIRGESGVGKELVARQIHEVGPRRNQPFIAVNCGAIPSELMESEFFGSKKGSFTGAHEDKMGLFQAANGGTLFLDEIAELPLFMQVKLLRAIQEKAVRPIGHPQEIKTDVRIVSASNKNLGELVAKDLFRAELFYRIHVIELSVPSLRERRDDVGELALHILNKLCHEQHLPPVVLGEKALAQLMQYDFPGNVRELENILERALTLCEHRVIMPHDLQLPSSKIATPIEGPLNERLGGIAKETILKTLEETRWNRTVAAKKLGMTLRTLRYRLKKFGLE